MSEKVKKSFVFHSEWIEAIKDIPPDKAVTLITLLNDYSCNEVEPEIEDPIVRALFKAFKPQVDEDIKKYKNKCKKSSEAINKRWNKNNKESVPTNTNVYQRIKSIPTNTNDTDNDYDYDNKNINNIFINKKEKNKKEKSKKFVPPTVEEVRTYCQERKNNIDPEYFVAYYEASGWKRGNNTPVRDYKALIRQWELRNWNNSTNSKKEAFDMDKYFEERMKEDFWENETKRDLQNSE